MDRFCRLIAYRPWWLLAFVAATTLFMASRMYDVVAMKPRLRIETAVNEILPDKDENRRIYELFRERFGNDELLLVALVGDDIFTAENLRRVQRMTRRLSRVEGVHQVVSLSNSPDIRAENGDLLVETIFNEVPVTGPELQELRDRVLGNPMHAGNIVSRDGRAAAILVYPREMSEKEFRDRGIDQEIARIAKDEAGNAMVVVAGAPLVKAATSRLLLADLLRFWPLSLAIMAVVGLVTFRSPRGVILPLASIGIAQVWTLGAVAASGRSLNLVTYVVPPLVLAVGFAYAAHVLSEHAETVRERGEAGPESAFLALRRVAPAILLTAATTAAGFLALTTSTLPAIRDFGIFCVVGVGGALLASLTFAPAVLSLLPVPASCRRGAEDARLERLAGRTAALATRYGGGILLAGAAVAALAIVGITQIRISTALAENLKPDNPIRHDMEVFNRHFDGSAQLYVMLDGGETDAFKDPERLEHLRSLQEWLDAQPEIGGTTSLADYLMVVNRALHQGDAEHFTIPNSASRVGQYLFFFWNDQLEHFIDRDFSAVSILIRAQSYDSDIYTRLLDRIEARFETLPDGMSAHVTGNSALIARTVDDIARGQAVSLSLATLFIYVILVAYFRSLRLGFYALLPNALPVVVYFGVLGLSGVTLNIITSLIACIILGIAVDDTIHFLVRFREKARIVGDDTRAAVEALRSVVRPVTSTTVALALGFLVLATSSLKHQVEFGWLAAFMLVFAWLVDMTFTPALASRMGLTRKERMLEEIR